MTFDNREFHRYCTWIKLEYLIKIILFSSSLLSVSLAQIKWESSLDGEKNQNLQQTSKLRSYFFVSILYFVKTFLFYALDILRSSWKTRKKGSNHQQTKRLVTKKCKNSGRLVRAFFFFVSMRKILTKKLRF